MNIKSKFEVGAIVFRIAPGTPQYVYTACPTCKHEKQELRMNPHTCVTQGRVEEILVTVLVDSIEVEYYVLSDDQVYYTLREERLFSTKEEAERKMEDERPTAD